MRSLREEELILEEILSFNFAFSPENAKWIESYRTEKAMEFFSFPPMAWSVVGKLVGEIIQMAQTPTSILPSEPLLRLAFRVTYGNDIPVLAQFEFHGSRQNTKTIFWRDEIYILFGLNKPVFISEDDTSMNNYRTGRGYEW